MILFEFVLINKGTITDIKPKNANNFFVKITNKINTNKITNSFQETKLRPSRSNRQVNF